MGGFATVTRLVKLPMPLIVASNGHTVAAGVFLLLAGDYRFGTDGDFKIVLNEVEIGMTMPYTALVIAKYRLTSQAFEQVINQSVVYSPIDSKDAGFLDKVVSADSLLDEAQLKAKALAELGRSLIRSIRWAVAKDFVDLLKQGIGQALRRR